MLALFTVPTDLLAQVGTYSSSVFTDFVPVAVIVAGIGLAVYAINWILRRMPKGRR